MSRFYFNIITSVGTISDEVGSELPDLDAARTEAIKDARALMSEAMRSGEDVSTRAMEICGESGEAVLIVQFTEAFTRVG
jgi:hypothetical protein